VEFKIGNTTVQSSHIMYRNVIIRSINNIKCTKILKRFSVHVPQELCESDFEQRKDGVVHHGSGLGLLHSRVPNDAGAVLLQRGLRRGIQVYSSLLLRRN